MRKTFVHRNDRVDQDGEIGTVRIAGEVRRSRRGQVSPGRKADDADPRGVYAPPGRIRTHQLDRLLHVPAGRVVVAVGHGVFQHDGGKPARREPLRHLIALMADSQAAVGTARADHHGRRRLLPFGAVQRDIGALSRSNPAPSRSGAYFPASGHNLNSSFCCAGTAAASSSAHAAKISFLVISIGC